MIKLHSPAHLKSCYRYMKVNALSRQNEDATKLEHLIEALIQSDIKKARQELESLPSESLLILTEIIKETYEFGMCRYTRETFNTINLALWRLEEKVNEELEQRGDLEDIILTA